MSATDWGIVSVPVIAVIAFLVTEAIKLAGVDDRWCPVIAGAVGAALGVVAMFYMPDFPAKDILTAIATGVVSGWGAVGFHQAVFVQPKKLTEEKQAKPVIEPEEEETTVPSYEEIRDEFKN